MEIIPSYAGTNYAPLKPLLALKEGSETSHYVADALKERFKHFKKLNDEVWKEIYSAGQLVELFAQGKQLLMPNPYTGGWKILRPRGEDESTKRAMNLMQFYTDNCLTKWLTADPQVNVRPGNDKDQTALSARYADAVLDHYEDRLFTTEFNIQEGLSALYYGTYINEFRYDSGAYGPEILKEIFEPQTIKMHDGYGLCGDCGTEGSGTDFQNNACPECGSTDTHVQPPESIQVNNAVGSEKVRMGDIIINPLPILACRWDLRKRAEESSWFLYQRRVPLTAIRALMGNVQLPGGETTDLGLDILQSLAYSGQAVSGRSVGGNNKKAWEDEVTICEFWMSVEDYGDIELKGDEQTVGGEPIPAEARLGDLFPDHLCVIGLNDLSVILGLYAESHQDTMASGTWHSKAHSGAGRGMQDTVEVQKRFNTLDSQALAYLQSTATPAVLYNQMLIQSDEMQYLGTPNKNVPVDMRQLPEGSRLSDAIWQFKPGALPGQFLEYNQQFLNHMFQLTSLVTDFTGGLNPVVRNYTATGANISASLSNSLFTPMLRVKASVRKREAKIILDLFKSKFPMERYFSFTGKHGRLQGISFKGSDICDDLVFDVVKGSENPRDDYSKRENIMNFFQTMGGAEGYMVLKEKYPEMMGSLEQLWNIEATGQSFDVVMTICRYRLSQLNTMTQQGIQDPTALIQGLTPPVSKLEPQQHEMALWWMDFLITDEGQQAPMPLRIVAEILIQTHFMNASNINQAAAIQGGMTQAAGMVGPGALQLMGQHMAPQPPAKAGPAAEDPEQAAKDRIDYDKAPPTIAAQMETDAGFKPGSEDKRPPLMAAKAQMIVAKKPAPKPATAAKSKSKKK